MSAELSDAFVIHVRETARPCTADSHAAETYTMNFGARYS